MDSKELGLTPKALLEAARLEGYRVSNDQRKRWAREGLLPHPVQDHVRGIRGSESRYPPGTLEQLVAVARLHRSERRFDELRLDLWWEGYWVEPDRLRASLAGLLDDAVAEFREIRT